MPTQGGDDSEVETVGKYNLPNNEGASKTAKGLGPAALAAAPAMFEGLSGAQARRKVHMPPRGDTYKELGQGDDNKETGIVVTQVVDGQITGHESPKKQQASGLQAAQATGNAANHPAYWGGETRGGSWDDNSQDTPPAPAKKTALTTILLILTRMRTASPRARTGPTTSWQQPARHLQGMRGAFWL